MDEGKNPNPQIYTVDEVTDLKEEISEFLDQLKNEDGVGHLVARMSTLLSDLDQPQTQSKMVDASTLYNDIQWEYYQVLKKKSFDRKQKESMERRRLFAQKCIMSSLTSNREDDLIVGMSGSRFPWNCGDE
jgi:hypothetical protein